MNLKDAIEQECRKLISRYHRSHGRSLALAKRFSRVTGQDTHTPTRLPQHWLTAPCFNPFRVRKRAKYVAKSMLEKISSDDYHPLPSLVLRIEKAGGGTRPITIFPVADAALASSCFRSIMSRNTTRMSPFSYAYREDIDIHDAIERLVRETSIRSHHYLVEFDFSKYFETIEHASIMRTISEHFKVTRRERLLIERFLGARRAFGVESYKSGSYYGCHKGIPQGNTLSLFLANVACHKLDLELTRAGHLFARYADDIIVVCESRTEAEDAREHILDHCNATGLTVNFRKSRGVSEVGPHGLRESSSTIVDFEFLGHRMSHRLVAKRGSPAKHVVRRVSIRGATESRIRARLGRVIFSHLLRYPQKGLYRKTRVDAIAGVDWDLVTCINDLRRYVYGGLPEEEIRRPFANRRELPRAPRGVMAFFPHVNDIEQLKSLDGWLVNSLVGALARRKDALRTLGVHAYPHLTRANLLEATWYDAEKLTIENDVRLPSFVRAWKYARKALSCVELCRFPARGLHFGDEDLYS